MGPSGLESLALFSDVRETFLPLFSFFLLFLIFKTGILRVTLAILELAL